MASEIFQGLADGVNQFADAWPLGPFISAVVIFAAILLLRFLAEITFDLITIDVTFSDFLIQFLVFLPLALLWIWIFSGVVTTLGIAAFLIGYIESILAAIFIAS
jgi:hypothetical protein